MSGLKRTFYVGLGVVAIGLVVRTCLFAAQPQNAKANWDNLKQLVPGDQIKIVLIDAKAYAGQFQGLTDDTLTLRLVTGEQTLARETVLRVSAKSQPHRGRNALIGMVVGMGGGVGVGVAGCANDSYACPADIGSGIMGGGMMGAAVGALIPTGGWHDVYRAR